MSARRFLFAVLASVFALVPPASATQVEKIAGGLDNPRHLAFGEDGLYVAEAGTGGSGPCFAGPEGSVCYGATGALTLIERNGNQARVADGLPSLGGQGTGAAALGPHGVYAKGDEVFFTNGGPAEVDRDALAANEPVADLFGRVLKLKEHGGIKRIADIWGFERDNNPDAKVGEPGIDSNAVDVLADGRRLIVADAGGNTLLKVRKHGSIDVLSVFANRSAPNPFGPGDVPLQAVPTGVVRGPDGDYYMTQLTGFPFPVGAANVYRVDADDGDAEVFSSGFTNLMDLAFDRKGTLWVLEIDHDSLLTPIGPSDDGAIFAVNRQGVATQLSLPAGTLTDPGGITVARDGSLYVTNKSTSPGGGEVLRIKPDAGNEGKGRGKDDDDDGGDDDHRSHHNDHHGNHDD